LYNGSGDHYLHIKDGGYDWHVNQGTDISKSGIYSGDLVRDDAVAFIKTRLPDQPFFLYLPFQEAHHPFQCPQAYADLYPNFASTPNLQQLAGMVTYTDSLIGDIVDALNETGLLANTILVFASDNGGPGGQGQEGVPLQSRFDPVILDRNYPFRGQKHEVYEGGVRVAAFVNSPLLPPSSRGTESRALFHVTDWLPTLASAAHVPLSRPHHALDGTDQWNCLLGGAPCSRKEVLIHFNTQCDEPGSPPNIFVTECPAPKAGLRVAQFKLLAECYNVTTHAFQGALQLYDVSADPSESVDLSADRPEEVRALRERLAFWGEQAAQVAPLTATAPWQGVEYWCAQCEPGAPQGQFTSWEPWCPGADGVPCLMGK
jgi:arylsulfatase A-like enzyme